MADYKFMWADLDSLASLSNQELKLFMLSFTKKIPPKIRNY